MKWIERAKSWFRRNKGKQVSISSKDTAGALLKNVDIITDDINRIGQLRAVKIKAADKVAKEIDDKLSVVIYSDRIKVKPKKIDKKVKALDILISYGLTRRQAKRYLKVKYIYKRTKNGRIRLKCEKTLYEFNCKYIYSKEDFYNE